MNIEQAQTIIDAFGPCTDVYECHTAKDLVTIYEDEDPKEVVRIELSVMSIRQDRECGMAALQAETYGDKYHADAVSEAHQQTKEIKQRLKKAGLL